MASNSFDEEAFVDGVIHTVLLFVDGVHRGLVNMMYVVKEF